MKKPLIGIMASGWLDDRGGLYQLGAGYMHWVAACGGLPVMLHYTADPAHWAGMLGRLDGLLFSGGADLDPASFGEAPIPQLGAVDSARDGAERALFDLAVAQRRLPILGICKGMQLLNVFMGGSLYQDIDAQYPGRPLLHRQAGPPGRPTHPIAILPGTPLAAGGLLEARVNTFHHQAVRDLAPGLEVMATAPDGIVEAFWAPDRPFLWGVQFHPEWLEPQSPLSRHIFESFVAACV